MAVRNPWLRSKNPQPQYEKPPADPLERRLARKFSVSPKAVDAVKSLKARIAKQRNMSERSVYVSPQAIVEELSPYTLHRKLGEEEHQYAKRAYEMGMLTDIELKFLIQQELGYLGTQDTKNKLGAHDDRAEELRQGPGPEFGKQLEMRPFLVNVSWTYGGSSGGRGKRGSPPVKYSIEGIFYGWDAELTMEAAREFLMDNMADSSSYKAKAVMDIGDFDISVGAADQQISGAMEVPGEAIRKRFGDVIADDRFSTKVDAFFEHPENRRVYTDKDFGYRDSPVRYRWVGERIVKD